MVYHRIDGDGIRGGILTSEEVSRAVIHRIFSLRNSSRFFHRPFPWIKAI
jgi:hypothetical protein